MNVNAIDQFGNPHHWFLPSFILAFLHAKAMLKRHGFISAMISA